MVRSIYSAYGFWTNITLGGADQRKSQSGSDKRTLRGKKTHFFVDAVNIIAFAQFLSKTNNLKSKMQLRSRSVHFLGKPMYIETYPSWETGW